MIELKLIDISLTTTDMWFTHHHQDLTIVAVTVPSLTDQFKTVNDIGWYSAA